MGLEPEWGVVANVIAVRAFGPGGKEFKAGTRQLAPGGKVHVFAEFGGSPKAVVTVVGRHRMSKRYITLHMRLEHLTNFRAQLIYSPYVLRQIRAWGWFSTPARLPEDGKRRAEACASRLALHPALVSETKSEVGK